MKHSFLFCFTLLLLQACASKPVIQGNTDNTAVLCTSDLEKRLYEVRLLNEAQTEKAKHLLEMDINALLILLFEYDKKGELRDESKRTFESAKAYRRQHPFKVSAQDEVDFPGFIFDAEDEMK